MIQIYRKIYLCFPGISDYVSGAVVICDCIGYIVPGQSFAVVLKRFDAHIAGKLHVGDAISDNI